jgi:hypothetical protein
LKNCSAATFLHSFGPSALLQASTMTIKDNLRKWRNSNGGAYGDSMDSTTPISQQASKKTSPESCIPFRSKTSPKVDESRQDVVNKAGQELHYPPEHMQQRMQQLEAEQIILSKRCAFLETSAETDRRARDVLKVKNTLETSQLRLQVDSLKEDKQFLTEKCQEFRGKVVALRMDKDSKQNRINALEVEIKTSQQLDANIRTMEQLEAQLGRIYEESTSNSEMLKVHVDSALTSAVGVGVGV